VYGPVRTVVWEGRSRKAPPYPDHCPMSEVGQTLHFHLVALTSVLSQLADMLGGYQYCRQRGIGNAE
jgi:hypothetical protein